MTPELKAEAAKLETQYAELDAEYKGAKAAYDAARAEMAPLEERMREAEAVLDRIKPVRKTLGDRLVHLRKVVG